MTRACFKFTLSATLALLLTEQSETSSSKQTVSAILAIGIDSLGIQSLVALVTQFRVTNGSRPLQSGESYSWEKPSALAEGVFTIGLSTKEKVMRYPQEQLPFGRAAFARDICANWISTHSIGLNF